MKIASRLPDVVDDSYKCVKTSSQMTTKRDDSKPRHKHNRIKSMNKTCVYDLPKTTTDTNLLISPTVSYSMNLDPGKGVFSPKDSVMNGEIPMHILQSTKNKYPPNIAYSIKKFKMRNKSKKFT